MIIVSIDVPMMDEQYDFQIDEDVILGLVIDEITEMVLRKNRCNIYGDQLEIQLWDRKRNLLMNPNATAYENGLISGSELILA